MENYQETYEKNRQALENYPWWHYGILPDFDELSEEARQVDEALFLSTKINTKPFFRDLSKPLLVKNERNSYNFGYLVDNVRASEDFGGDNHIYMYYDNREEYYWLLQAIDITPYLLGKKIVFLIGEEELAKHYPINFKNEYGIDYEAMGSKPLRVDEIQRLIMNWHNFGYSGNLFWSGVLDWHKNLLTIKDFGLVGVHYLYGKVLKGRTVKEVYEYLLNNESWQVRLEFDALFSPMHGSGFSPMNASGKTIVPTVRDFFLELEKLFPKEYCPKENEWIKGIFLAYNVALGRSLNSRIVPAVVFHSHSRGPMLNMNYNIGWIKGFKYFRCISLLRRKTTALASFMESDGKWSNLYNFQSRNPLLMIFTTILSLKIQDKAIGDDYSMTLYADEDSFYYPYTRIIRFEDIKLEPKATMEAVLDFIDVEWDNNLMHTTANGKKEVWHGSEKPVKDFDSAPVLRKRERMIAPFDYYRIELVIGNYLAPWGYKPQYYTDGRKFSDVEVMEMFKKPFMCEKWCYTNMQKQMNEEIRRNIYEAVKEILNRKPSITSDGRTLVPIRWLKPKLEYMKGKLYE